MPTVAIGQVTISKLYDGESGVGISTVQGYYAVNNNDSVAPTVWNTTPQKTTTTNRFLWYYDVLIFTDNTKTETSKRVIGTYGTTGQDGKDAPSITYVVTEYYLSDSDKTLVGGTWSISPPEWKVDTYYWVRTVTTLSDKNILRSEGVYDIALTE